MRKRLLAIILMAAFLLSGCAYSSYELDTESYDSQRAEAKVTEETTEAAETTEAVEETEAPATQSETVAETEPETTTQALIDENGSYTTMEDVSLYIYTYGCLPQNFITKNEARDLGWEGGSLEPYAPGMCIGGDYFGNYEGLLPDGEYRECDIDTLGADSRGAKRIIYTEDCSTIYYTDDHYASFTLLYGEE